MYVVAETKLCNNPSGSFLCMMMGDGDDEDENNQSIDGPMILDGGDAHVGEIAAASIMKAKYLSLYLKLNPQGKKISLFMIS